MPKRVLKDLRVEGAARSHCERQKEWKGRPQVLLSQLRSGSSSSGMRPVSTVEDAAAAAAGHNKQDFIVSESMQCVASYKHNSDMAAHYQCVLIRHH